MSDSALDHGPCALEDCTNDAAERLITPPAWETYLREERNYSGFHHLEIPLCVDHYPTYEYLHEATYQGMTDLSDEKRAEVTQRVESFLNSLDLEVLITEFPSDPDHIAETGK